MNVIELNFTDDIPEDVWIPNIKKLLKKSNLIVVSEDYSYLNWFATNLFQFLAKGQNNEVASLYGKHIDNLDDFCYQYSKAFPWGYIPKSELDPIYDCILNITTWPEQRYLLWNDTDHMISKSIDGFKTLHNTIMHTSYILNNNVDSVYFKSRLYSLDFRVVYFIHSVEDESIREMFLHDATTLKWFDDDLNSYYDYLKYCVRLV